MQISEKWLGEIGGWQAMKAARLHLAQGRVNLSQHQPDMLRGSVGEGRSAMACSLQILSPKEVRCSCRCPAAQRGLVCDHALALGLKALQGLTPQMPKPTGPGPKAVNPPIQPTRPEITALQIRGRYRWQWPTALAQGSLKGRLSLMLRHDPEADPPECSALAGWLAQAGVRETSAPLTLDGPRLEEMLRHATPQDHFHFASSPDEALRLAVEPSRLPTRLSIDTDGRLHLHIAPQVWPLLQGHWQGHWFCAATLTLWKPTALDPELLSWLEHPKDTRSLTWWVEHRQRLEQCLQIEQCDPSLQRLRTRPAHCRFALSIDGDLSVVRATLRAHWQDQSWCVGDSSRTCVANSLFPAQSEDDSSCFFTRPIAEEARHIALLQSAGFEVEASSSGLHWRLSKAENCLRLHASELKRLACEMQVETSERWQRATASVLRIAPELGDAKGGQVHGGGNDWLVMQMDYRAADGFSLPRAEVMRLLRSGQRSVKVKGRHYVLDQSGIEDFEQSLGDVSVELTSSGLRLRSEHAHHFGQGNPASFETVDPLTWNTQVGALSTQLRPYQAQGAQWITTLARAGRGALLADDMGLGKTVQTIAAILALKDQQQLPTLIVCPKSLLGNWQAELARFAPDLTVLRLEGTKRSGMLENLANFRVVLTSYPLAVRDQGALQSQPWSLLVMDEASQLRNPDTEAARCMRSLRAHARVALSGTPIENSVRDLWSISECLNPGYLGRRDHFRERFEKPLETQAKSPAAEQAAMRLRRLMRPYLLRRTKTEVLRELPEKIEQQLLCEASPAQTEIYRRLLQEGLAEIRDARKRSGEGGARMTMFTVLLRLRQCCCDLRLLGLPPTALRGLGDEDLSPKTSALGQQIEAIVAGGGKVLVFSQFVQWLRLLRSGLEQAGHSPCYLDGSSQDRDEQVAAFQGNAQRRIFLISLKAGGYGLNLTAADHVILMDPWWNPAVEAQAIDRAHRFGQQRVVQATRLILRGSVEERILALQAKKRGLIEASIDETSPMAMGLDASELESLLETTL